MRWRLVDYAVGLGAGCCGGVERVKWRLEEGAVKVG